MSNLKIATMSMKDSNKIFAVVWEHNYGLSSAIIIADSLDKAEELILSELGQKHIWAGYAIREIDKEEFYPMKLLDKDFLHGVN